MRYVRDVPADDQAAVDAERDHVIAHLSAVADSDDDPTTRAEDVRTWVINLARVVGDEPGPRMVRIIGEIDAEPDAPYLQDAYDFLAGVDSGLYDQEVAAAVRDLEALRGQA